ncbi:hypothetical protein C8R44DRAFT_811912 [Mycena epipterygia]|nr:hypothetical protein C8R44DRAFT_811912 [Mycena epipterygia]
MSPPSPPQFNAVSKHRSYSMIPASPFEHDTQKPRLATENMEGTLGFSFISDAIDHELRVFWDFTWRDWSMSLIPGTMRTVAALRSLDVAPSSALVTQSLMRSFIYSLLYIYAFDIANQINGVAEDRINKPDRPLSSGRVSLQGAYIRWYVTTAAHLVVGAAWGVLPWTVLWHWTTKNLLFMSVGSFCLLQAAWELVAPITAHEWRWVLLLSGVFGIIASVQDMRDVEGDKIAGRRTLPIFLNPTHWLVDYCGVALTLAMLYMAYPYDHGTYMVCYA